MPGDEPKVIGRRTLVPGPKYNFDELTVRNPGRKDATRAVVTHPGAVVVVPVMEDGRLVLIRNFRVAVEDTGAWVLEFCAGTLDIPGEDPIDCAARELIEECGYRAKSMTPLLSLTQPIDSKAQKGNPPHGPDKKTAESPASPSAPPSDPTAKVASGAGYFYTTPGLTSERMFPFVATGLEYVGQDLEEYESIEVVTMTPAQAWKAVEVGERRSDGRTMLMDAKSIVALTLATRRGFVRI
ncbi:MAG: NUDIX hydrolase [Phycisphaerales bacterium]